MRHSSFAAELRDAVTPRAFFLMVAVFLVQLGFLLSYIGSFHHPEPHRIPIAVAAPQQVADKLDGLPGEPVRATVVKGEKAAGDRIMHRKAEAAYVMDPKGNEDTLLVASAAGSSVTQAAQEIGKQTAADQKRELRTKDIAPANAEDHGSLTAFYLVIGWLVGGYLAASMLGVTAGARPANVRRAVMRLLTMAVYGVLSGIGGAVIVGPVLGALPGHFWQLAGLGALIVFATGAMTTALQVLFGVIGIGLAIVIFVVLGNPSAGGAYQGSMIPPFWRVIGEWLPPGAGTHAVRNIVYFDANALAKPLWVLAVWAAVGIALALLGALLHFRRRDVPLERMPLGRPMG
ncbi:DUF3533 domain-containing protein [Streptomyces sp. ODS28]|uniref:DUF3533 domain-containing protein n=1 Tax=Streptomyces sp. ODS28 TaxID=3136688 RepID=UPI0031E8AC64